MTERSWEDALEEQIQVNAARRRKLIDWSEPESIEEIRVGAIIPSGDMGEYQIQACTARGLRNFHAVESTDRDQQSDSEAGATAFDVELVQAVFKFWKSVPVKPFVTVPPQDDEPVVAAHQPERLLDEEVAGKEHTAERVLQLLRSNETPEAKLRQAVLQAEVLEFNDRDRVELCEHLRTYILRHRNSNVAQDLVAVASAIRKLVACMPAGELGLLNELLTPTPRMGIPLEIELEVAKTVVRKLTWHPPLHDDSEQDLAARLMDVAESYLNPRLLTREKYGATALNAVLALLLLRSRHVPCVISRVRDLAANWFSQSACRRVERLQQQLQLRVSDETLPAITRGLVEFTSQVRHQDD